MLAVWGVFSCDNLLNNEEINDTIKSNYVILSEKEVLEMFLKRWKYIQPDTALASELAETCEINPVLALLLTTRGITTPEEVFSFLAGQEEEADPFAFADMDKAAARISRAIEAHSAINVSSFPVRVSSFADLEYSVCES